jgi:hypothetical protein
VLRFDLIELVVARSADIEMKQQKVKDSNTIDGS